MDTKEALEVIEGLLFLGGGAMVYTANMSAAAGAIALAGILRLVEPFVK